MEVLHHYKLTRFSNQYYHIKTTITVLHHYKLTRFSNLDKESIIRLLFYTITNLQGSQTDWSAATNHCSFYTITNLQGSQTQKFFALEKIVFYTITNLQGSQTSNEIITEPARNKPDA